MQKGFALFFASALIIFGVAFVFLPTQFPRLTPEKIFAASNKARWQAGLPLLHSNFLLNHASGQKLNDMTEKLYFAHSSPRGVQPWQWIDESGYAYAYAGENLAMNYSSAEKLVQAWLESPTHKKNLLNPDYKDVGIAVRQIEIEGRQYTFIVQMFGTPRVALAK